MTENDYKNELKDKFIRYRTCLNLPSDITFGIEIEYENIVKDTVSYLLEEKKYYNPNLIGWLNKSEIDIAFYNRNGEEENGEISSPILIDKISTWKSIRDVLKLLNKNGAIVTEKCGGHINIGTHIFGDSIIYWRNFLIMWILYESEIYNFSSGEFFIVRKDNKNLFQKITTELKSDIILNMKSAKDIPGELFDKYHDVYIAGYYNEFKADNKIEFRLPNGTLNEEIWQNYINFFAKFLIACKKELDIEKVLYKIKNKESSAVELADYIFDNELDKEYFLIQTLKTNKVYKKELPKHIDSVIYK